VDVTSVVPFKQSGKVRVIAVTGSSRSPNMPDVPTLQEQGVPDFNVGAWLGYIAPAGTPAPIVDKLHADIVATLNNPAVQKRLVALGTEVVTSESPQAFRKFVVDNHRMWGDVVKKVGISQ
jgi:tripartite-type tricarboxylate transporter receptor subunit TctC